MNLEAQLQSLLHTLATLPSAVVHEHIQQFVRDAVTVVQAGSSGEVVCMLARWLSCQRLHAQLWSAAEEAVFLLMQRLLAHEADCNTARCNVNLSHAETGRTALLSIGATWPGSVRILQLLLEHGAGPLVVDNQGNTLLHLLLLSKQFDVVHTLLDAPRGSPASLVLSSRHQTNGNGQTCFAILAPLNDASNKAQGAAAAALHQRMEAWGRQDSAASNGGGANDHAAAAAASSGPSSDGIPDVHPPPTHIAASSTVAGVSMPAFGGAAPSAANSARWPHGVLEVRGGSQDDVHLLWGQSIIHELPAARPEHQMSDDAASSAAATPTLANALRGQADGHDYVTLHFTFSVAARPAWISFEPMGGTESMLHFLHHDQATPVHSVRLLGVYEPIRWGRWRVCSYTRVDGIMHIVLRMAKFFAWPAERVCANHYIARTHVSNAMGATSEFRVCTFVLLTHDAKPQMYLATLKGLLGALILQQHLRADDPRLAFMTPDARQKLVQLFERFAPLQLHRYAQTSGHEQLSLFDWVACDPSQIHRLQCKPSHMVMFISHAHLFGPMVLAGAPLEDPLRTGEEIRVDSDKLLNLLRRMCAPTNPFPVEALIFTGCSFGHSNFLKEQVATQYPQVRIVSYMAPVSIDVGHPMAIAMYLSLYFLGDTATILPIVNEGNRLGIASPIQAIFQHLRAADSQFPLVDGATAEMYNPDGIYANFDGNAQFWAELMDNALREQDWTKRHQFLVRQYQPLQVTQSRFQRGAGPPGQIVHNGRVIHFNWDVHQISFGSSYTPNPLHRATTFQRR